MKHGKIIWVNLQREVTVRMLSNEIQMFKQCKPYRWGVYVRHAAPENDDFVFLCDRHGVPQPLRVAWWLEALGPFVEVGVIEPHVTWKIEKWICWKPFGRVDITFISIYFIYLLMMIF